MAQLFLARKLTAAGSSAARLEKYELARNLAQRALELGDRPVVAHLLLALAEAGRGNTIGARDQLLAARETWPADLRANGYIFTFDGGQLWFESQAELESLRRRAEASPGMQGDGAVTHDE